MDSRLRGNDEVEVRSSTIYSKLDRLVRTEGVARAILTPELSVADIDGAVAKQHRAAAVARGIEAGSATLRRALRDQTGQLHQLRIGRAAAAQFEPHQA